MQQGRTAEAEAEFERLLGGAHVKFAMQELSKLDRGDDSDVVHFSELLYGRCFRGTCIFIFGYAPTDFVSMFVLHFGIYSCYCRHQFLSSASSSLMFSLGFVIHMFLLQLFLLGQPYLLYNSYLA